jgi:hypothetical protein
MAGWGSSWLRPCWAAGWACGTTPASHRHHRSCARAASRPRRTNDRRCLDPSTDKNAAETRVVRQDEVLAQQAAHGFVLPHGGLETLHQARSGDTRGRGDRDQGGHAGAARVGRRAGGLVVHQHRHLPGHLGVAPRPSGRPGSSRPRPIEQARSPHHLQRPGTKRPCASFDGSARVFVTAPTSAAAAAPARHCPA